MRRGWVWNRDKVTRSLAIAAACCALRNGIRVRGRSDQDRARRGAFRRFRFRAIRRGYHPWVVAGDRRDQCRQGRPSRRPHARTGTARRRDSTPPKGSSPARSSSSQNVAAVLGGIDTPVSMAVVPRSSTKRNASASACGPRGPRITHNGANPNYAFPRLSGRRAGRCQAAQIRASEVWFVKASLALINNPWVSRTKLLMREFEQLDIDQRVDR